MISNHISLVKNGDTGITILFDCPISEKLSRQIIALAKACQTQFTNELEQIIPAYQSLTLCYFPEKISYQSLSGFLEKKLTYPLPEDKYPSQQVTIPVCYEDEYATDLNKVAEHCGLSKQQIIDKHSQTEYFVHMLGFSPGFLYLGGLDPQLACPRKTSPDLNVPAGSVGIGASQTGIYPQNSPGGWHIIGRTPAVLFDIKQHPSCIAQPLDKVRFKSITADEYQAIIKGQPSLSYTKI